MSFCPYPFVSFSLQQGHNVRPCCHYKQTDNDISANDFVKSPIYHLEDGVFQNIRQRMLNGEKLPECEVCHQNEKSVGRSRRLTGLQKWSDVERVNKWNELRHLEIMIDNLCNFECRMCNSWQSSKLQKRDAFLRKDVSKASKADVSFLQVMDLSKLESMALQGGEPFMSPNLERIIDIIEEQVDLKNIKLYITSNGSVIPSDAIMEKLLRFREIDLTISMESSHKVNDYIRHHSNKEVIFENIKVFDQLENTEINISSNVNAYNADTMPDTESFVLSMGYDFYWWWTTNTPCALDYAPDEYKEWLYDRVKDTKFETAYREYFLDKQYNEQRWQEFIDETKRLDEWYGVSLSDYHPDLAKFLNI